MLHDYEWDTRPPNGNIIFLEGKIQEMDTYHRLSVPTFLIHGQKDKILSYKFTSLLEKEIRDCRLWIPEESTHSNIEEHPNYEKNIISFIKSNLTR